MKRVALMLAAATLVLAGCASGPTTGTVHDKSYHGSYVYFISTGKVMMPEFVPAEWQLDLYASDTDHGWVEVDQTTYDAYQIGDHYPK